MRAHSAAVSRTMRSGPHTQTAIGIGDAAAVFVMRTAFDADISRLARLNTRSEAPHDKAASIVRAGSSTSSAKMAAMNMKAEWISAMQNALQEAAAAGDGDVAVSARPAIPCCRPKSLTTLAATPASMAGMSGRSLPTAGSGRAEEPALAAARAAAISSGKSSQPAPTAAELARARCCAAESLRLPMPSKLRRDARTPLTWPWPWPCACIAGVATPLLRCSLGRELEPEPEPSSTACREAVAAWRGLVAILVPPAT